MRLPTRDRPAAHTHTREAHAHTHGRPHTATHKVTEPPGAASVRSNAPAGEPPRGSASFGRRPAPRKKKRAHKVGAIHHAEELVAEVREEGAEPARQRRRVELLDEDRARVRARGGRARGLARARRRSCFAAAGGCRCSCCCRGSCCRRCSCCCRCCSCCSCCSCSCCHCCRCRCCSCCSRCRCRSSLHRPENVDAVARPLEARAAKDEAARGGAVAGLAQHLVGVLVGPAARALHCHLEVAP